MAIAGVPGRTLPPLVQQTGNTREPIRYRSDPSGSQTSLPRKGPNTTQQHPAVQPYACPPVSPYQYKTAMSSTTGLTRSPYALPVDSRGSSNSMGPRSAYENSSIHGASAQSAYGGRKLQPSEETFRSSAHHSSTSSKQGPPTPSSATALAQPRNSAQDITARYQLHIRQQPVAARACGFGERDRRVVDPPPILQLLLRDYNPRSPSDVSELKYPLYVVHCTLRSASGAASIDDDVTAVEETNVNGSKVTRKLTGTLVASPITAVDPDTPAHLDRDSRLGCFFLFPDLSCRQTGRYTLRFTIMKLGIQPMAQGSTIPVLATVDSDQFEVYSAKDFPGMQASTALTKDLKRQGALVSVKKGIESRSTTKRSSSKGSSVGDAESGAKSPSATPERRRRR